MMLESLSMRTTIRLDDDVSAAVRRIQQVRSIGLSEAVNDLIRAGLRDGEGPKGKERFRQRSRALGLRIDVTNVAEALEVLEGPQNR